MGRRARQTDGAAFVGRGHWTVVDEADRPIDVVRHPEREVIANAEKQALFDQWAAQGLTPGPRWFAAKRRIDARRCPECRGQGSSDWPGAQIHLGICGGCGGGGVQYAYEWGWFDDTDYVCMVCMGTGTKNAVKNWQQEGGGQLTVCHACQA